jgi:tetratricopeptide (TPR) repeat protein
VITGSDRDMRSGQRVYSVRIFLLCCLPLFVTAALGVDSRQALQNAASLVEGGRLEEADQQAHLALSDPDTHAVACAVLGTIRFQQKRLTESVDFLQEAIRLDSHLVGARLSLAQVYIVQGKKELAVPLYRRVLSLDPSNSAARFALVNYEAEKGNYRKSLELAQPILSGLKQTPDGLFTLATDYLNTDDRVSAAALAKDWAKLGDVSADWSIKFALLLAKQGVVAEAVDILEEVKQKSTPSYELLFDLAGAYLLKKDLGRALECYDQALTLKPESLPALQQAAGTAEQRGELEHSLSYWMRAKKIEPNNAGILFGFGRVCLKMDLLSDAEPALARAATLSPDNPSYQYMLAAAKVGQKQFEEAQGILAGLVKEHPKDAQLHYAMGSVAYLQGHLDDAAVHLSESVRLQPDQLAPYYYLALVARDQGREGEAIQALEDVLKRYPDHALSCEALGSLLMSARRYPEAEASLEKAVRLNPKSVKSNYQLGLLLTRMGKKEEADKRLELAKSLRKDDEENSRLQLRLTDPDQ